jgi:hypothetical protein
MSEFHNGLKDFENNNHLSIEEQEIAKMDRSKTFEDGVEKLKKYAEEIAHAEQVIYMAKKAALVRQFLGKIGGIEHLTEKQCNDFAERNKNYFDQGELVYAIAVALDKDLMK